VGPLDRPEVSAGNRLVRAQNRHFHTLACDASEGYRPVGQAFQPDDGMP
jgi:hypothetical protein